MRQAIWHLLVYATTAEFYCQSHLANIVLNSVIDTVSPRSASAISSSISGVIYLSTKIRQKNESSNFFSLFHFSAAIFLCRCCGVSLSILVKETKRQGRIAHHHADATVPHIVALLGFVYHTAKV